MACASKIFLCSHATMDVEECIHVLTPWTLPEAFRYPKPTQPSLVPYPPNHHQISYAIKFAHAWFWVHKRTDKVDNWNTTVSSRQIFESFQAKIFWFACTSKRNLGNLSICTKTPFFSWFKLSGLWWAYLSESQINDHGPFVLAI